MAERTLSRKVVQRNGAYSVVLSQDFLSGRSWYSVESPSGVLLSGVPEAQARGYALSLAVRDGRSV